jgi:NAD(P)-dependent dehydrogenase (short-subunit alcohol dehydrogenase family)
MRKVLVTGSTSGFGRLMVREFLKHGDLVIATGRNLQKRPELFTQERNEFSTRLLELNLDVTDPAQIKNVVKRVESLVGSIDILINNAGYGLFGALEDLDEQEIRHQMEVNFFGIVQVTQAFLPMLRLGKGKIFNLSSVFGFMGFPLTSLYCASKYAVEGLTESLRSELKKFGVQVCLIEPGGYRTDFGTNLKWSQNNQDSVYAQQMQNYREMHSFFSEKKTQEPIEVANGILKLSLRNSLPMRKVFGQDAKLSYFMKILMPEWIYFFIMDFVFHKMLHKK